MSEFAHLLSDLRFEQTEWVQIANRAPGEELRTVRLMRDDAIEVVDKALASGVDEEFFFGVNPVGKGDGRAKASEVLRYSSIYLDLDFKESGLGSQDNAAKFLAAFCEAVEWQPCALIHTGMGFQVYWGLSREDNFIHEAKLEAKRFEVYAQTLASDYGYGMLDSVSDPTRLFRVPGSINMKYDHKPTAYRVAAIHTSAEGISTCLTAAQLGLLNKNPFLM